MRRRSLHASPAHGASRSSRRDRRDRAPRADAPLAGASARRRRPPARGTRRLGEHEQLRAGPAARRAARAAGHDPVDQHREPEEREEPRRLRHEGRVDPPAPAGVRHRPHLPDLEQGVQHLRADGARRQQVHDDPRRPRLRPAASTTQRPNNINILYAIGSIYFDKLGNAPEKHYYRERVREETHAARRAAEAGRRTTRAGGGWSSTRCSTRRE